VASVDINELRPLPTRSLPSNALHTFSIRRGCAPPRPRLGRRGLALNLLCLGSEKPDAVRQVGAFRFKHLRGLQDKHDI
jgi:hypothetical protein